MPIEEAQQFDALVILGMPGVGKSEAMKHLHSREKGVLITAKQMALEGASNARNKNLFIDGLDEKRPRAAPEETTEDFIRAVIGTDAKKIRIACRTIDWLGPVDNEDFQSVFKRFHSAAIVELEPFTVKDAESLVSSSTSLSAKDFVRDASKNGLDHVLGNPDALQKLVRLVEHGGGWPKSTFELYTKVVDLLLEEASRRHKLKAKGKFSSSDLRAAAGAICAAMLISDTEKIFLEEPEFGAKYPSLISIPGLSELEREAVVSRKLFDVEESIFIKPEHRTTAEFVAAEWLASKTQDGLSLERIKALLTIDGKPAPELRALYAWIPAFLRSDATSLVNGDPFGIATYGQVADYDLETKSAILQSLVAYSKSVPWFRGGSDKITQLGQLSHPDLSNQLQSILNDPDSSQDLKLCVLDICRAGTPQPVLAENFEQILSDSEASLRLRLAAFDSLCVIGGSAQRKAYSFVTKSARGRSDTIRLRVEIMTAHWGDEFSYEDLSQVINDQLMKSPDRSIGNLWPLRSLAEYIGSDEIEFFRSNIDIPPDHDTVNVGTMFEVLSDWISSAIKREKITDVPTIWRWLKWINHFYPDYSSRNADSLLDEIRLIPDFENSLLDHIIDTDFEQSSGFVFWRELETKTLGLVDESKLLGHFEQRLNKLSVVSEADAKIYEFCILRSFDSTRFDRFYEIAEKYPELVPVRQKACYWPIENWRTERSRNSIETRSQQEQTKINNLEKFDTDQQIIRSGSAKVWLGWITRHFYFQSSDGPNGESAFTNIETYFGEDRAKVVLDGYLALISEDRNTAFEEIASLKLQEKCFHWWFACIAAMDEITSRQITFPVFRSATVEFLLTINTLHAMEVDYHELSSRTVRWVWVRKLIEEYPEQARVVYSKLLDHELKHETNYSIALGDFQSLTELKAIAKPIAVKALSEHPGAHPNHLQRLVSIIHDGS